MTIATDDRRYPQFSLGDRLRKARELTGMDRSRFAEALGISRDSVHAYEVGKTVPRQPVLVSWAFATGTDVEWLKSGVYPGDNGLTPVTLRYQGSERSSRHMWRLVALSA